MKDVTVNIKIRGSIPGDMYLRAYADEMEKKYPELNFSKGLSEEAMFLIMREELPWYVVKGMEEIFGKQGGWQCCVDVVDIEVEFDENDKEDVGCRNIYDISEFE